jgi:hypothetical protein
LSANDSNSNRVDELVIRVDGRDSGLHDGIVAFSIFVSGVTIRNHTDYNVEQNRILQQIQSGPLRMDTSTWSQVTPGFMEIDGLSVEGISIFTTNLDLMDSSNNMSIDNTVSIDQTKKLKRIFTFKVSNISVLDSNNICVHPDQVAVTIGGNKKRNVILQSRGECFDISPLPPDNDNQIET